MVSIQGTHREKNVKQELESEKTLTEKEAWIQRALAVVEVKSIAQEPLEQLSTSPHDGEPWTLTRTLARRMKRIERRHMPHRKAEGGVGKFIPQLLLSRVTRLGSGSSSSSVKALQKLDRTRQQLLIESQRPAARTLSDSCRCHHRLLVTILGRI